MENRGGDVYGGWEVVLGGGRLWVRVWSFDEIEGIGEGERDGKREGVGVWVVGCIVN